MGPASVRGLAQLADWQGFDRRLKNVRALGHAFGEPTFAKRLVEAYVHDTAFRVADATHREVITPATLCKLPLLEARAVRDALPLGKVAVIVPRNSVGLTIAKAVVGAYLSGNEILVRMPAQLVRTMPLLEELLRSHLEGVTFAPMETSGKAFIESSLRDPRIAALVVYGDDAWIDAYRPLAEATGTRLFFEGPGSDPFIVMEGADVELAVDAAIRGGMHNGGQSCSAFERFFVHASLHDRFVACLVERLARMRIGSPFDPDAEVGPIASKTVLARIVDQIAEAQEQGARLAFGGTVVEDVHQGLPSLVPAVLTRAEPWMKIMADETFGNVFPIFAFDSDADLLPAVDATRYGLNAAAFGPGAGRLEEWLEERHRNVYVDATPFDTTSLPTRILDGGFRRSGFCWLPVGDRLETFEGRRLLAHALSRNAPFGVPT
jgi:succinate-semialdehyde dehydrogenase/glutarate-semialdehyde dehydrogenase